MRRSISKKKGKEKYCYNDVIVDQFAPVSKIRTSHRRRTGIPNGNWDRKNRSRRRVFPSTRRGGVRQRLLLARFHLKPVPFGSNIYLVLASGHASRHVSTRV